MVVIILFLSDEIRNEIYYGKPTVVDNPKCSVYFFFPDFKVLLLHSPTQVQTDGLF